MGLKNLFNYESTKSALKKAWSWAFLNNGNKVDHTRLRVSDGTPLHSTGIHRLKKDWRNVIALGLVGGTYAATAQSPDLEPTVKALLYSGGGILFDEVFHRWILRKRFGDRCFNTNPAKESHSLLDDEVDAQMQLSKFKPRAIVDFSVSALNAGFDINKGNIPLGMFNTWLISGAASTQHLIRFNKVAKGEWTMDIAPPPEKEQKKEKVSILEALFPPRTVLAP
jgi:hypothetical protein